MLATFASILDFFHYAFKRIILRASSSEVSVHFFHKSLSAISIPLDVHDKFYKMTFYFVNFFVCFTISVIYSFCLCTVTFVDCEHWHDFTLEKDA